MASPVSDTPMTRYLFAISFSLSGGLFCFAIAFCLSAGAADRAVAVIDNRNDMYSPAFRSRFEEELRKAVAAKGVAPVRVLYTRTYGRQVADAIREVAVQHPDLVYATTVDIAKAMRRADREVPMVFSGLANPLLEPAGDPLLTSITRPDGNMTGFVSHGLVDEVRVEFLARLHPAIRRIGVLLPQISFDDADVARREAYWRLHGFRVARFGEAVPASRTMRTVIVMRPPREGPLDRVLDMIDAARLDALDAPSAFLVSAHSSALIAYGAKRRLPVSFRPAEYARDGGVMSYEPLEYDYEAKAAGIIARILAGTPPADIPVEFPSEFVLSFNASAIRNLPYPVDKDLLKRANRVFP
jgi:putative ABC transport system substrate-binding protein